MASPTGNVIFTWDPDTIDHELATCERDPALRAIIEVTSNGGPVLEAGCGLSRWVKFLSERDIDITGLEYLGDTLKTVRARWPEIRLVQGDAADCPFGNDTFRAVLSLGVVEHFESGPDRPLAELHRVLQPGGKAVITVPCLNTLRRMKRKVWVDELVHLPGALYRSLTRGRLQGLTRTNPRYKFSVYPAYGDMHEYRLTPGEFLDAVRKVGLVIDHHEPIGMMDGMYHDLNPFKKLVRWEKHEFTAGGFVQALNEELSNHRFFHSHMQLIVAHKPTHQ